MAQQRSARSVIIAVVSIAALSPAWGAQSATPKYTAEQAKDHVGEFATVEGRVVSVYQSRAGNVFLNFGASYPRQTFTAVVFSSDVSKFGDLSRLEGATVQVTGVIKLYQGKPEIVVNDPAQLRVVGPSTKGSP